MEIKIKISKKVAEHLKDGHTWYDVCDEANEVLRKVEKEINKKIRKDKK